MRSCQGGPPSSRRFSRGKQTGTSSRTPPFRPMAFRPVLPTAPGSLAAAGTGAIAPFHRPRLVHGDLATIEIGAVQAGDGLPRLVRAGHFHEAEAARLPGELVG